MDRIKNVANSVENFVEKHRVGLAVTATGAFCLWINRLALSSHDEFLKEHDLYDEFYTPEEDF